MEYKYKKRQVFGKKLNVPKSIRESIYHCSLTFQDYVKYKLEDKIPITCLAKPDRELVERFGVEVCKELDWDLIQSWDFGHRMDYGYDIRSKLMSIDPKTDDINRDLYALIEDGLSPRDYSSKMRRFYSDRFFSNEEIYSAVSDTTVCAIMQFFNEGRLPLETILRYWDVFKDKDLTICLKSDYANERQITSDQVKSFMSKHQKLLSLILNHSDIYEFIDDISHCSEDEEFDFIKKYTDDLLSNTRREYGDSRPPVRLNDEEYHLVFEYSSFEEYLKKVEPWCSQSLIDQLKDLPDDYLKTMPIPISVLFSYEVLSFIEHFGLKNICDFDNECGQFFTRNDCEMLQLMYDMYIHYGGNDHNPKTSIYYDKDGNYIESPCTKDQFYEAMRRMIINGPSDWNYRNRAPDYRAMTGEFRVRNAELFIAEDAPEELQKLFYTKSITPNILKEHPDYIEYLRGKDLTSCLKPRSISVLDSHSLYGYENLYEFIGNKVGFDELMTFITDYCDILDVLYNQDYGSIDRIEVNSDEGFEQIQEKIGSSFRNFVIQHRVSYSENVPEKIRTQYPNMFLKEDAPPELKEAFYSRKIDAKFILSNPRYRDDVKDIDLDVLFSYMPISFQKSHYYYDYETQNLVTIIEKMFGHADALDVLLLYGDYIEPVYKQIQYRPGMSKNDLLDEIDRSIYYSILNNHIYYGEDLPTHFKNNYPTLFLGKDAPDDVREKFYGKKLSIDDFKDSSLLNHFEQTNVAFGFSPNLLWIVPLFEDIEKAGDMKTANSNRLIVLAAYERITDHSLKNLFADYMKKHIDTIDVDKVDIVADVLSRLEYSNSIEMFSFRTALAGQLLETEDPIRALNQIEKVFLENNLPLCGKMFLCFRILYPDLSHSKKFDFGDTSRVAPALKDSSLPDFPFEATNDQKRLIIIFNDLLRITCRSNERSLVEYLDVLDDGNRIYLKLQQNGFDARELSDEEMATLETFVNHLQVLYHTTTKGRENNLDLGSLPLEDRLKILGSLFTENQDTDLRDVIVNSFCNAAGIHSADELRALMQQAREEQSTRADQFLQELDENNGIFRIREGDFVRGIGYLAALSGSLGTGNFSKEHLGVFLGTSESDTTPLDVDLTLVTNTESLYDAIKGTPTGFGFGNVFIILKKDNPALYTSRDKDGNPTDESYDPSKVEVFGTKVGAAGYETHWGARTGVSLADVDCILYKKREEIDSSKPYNDDGSVNYCETNSPYRDDLPAIKFEIARNGYYVPVIDFSGRLIYTKEEYNALREKMQGLSYYHENSYTLSDELVTPEIEQIASEITDDSKNDTSEKRGKVNAVIKEVLDEMGLDIKYSLSGNLEQRSAEFIDTGSTGRNTNIPYDGDFDFFMRLDADIMRKPHMLESFRSRIINRISQFENEGCIITSNGDLRFKKVHIDEKTIIDIDISFGVKTSKVQYSSDECLKDRLSTIQKLYPEQYKYVVANIIQAKKTLKAANAYKPRRTDEQQGGIGGIGIETWVLQNGGSFVQACRGFLAAALDRNGNVIPFEEFKKKYEIWDFGENHFAARDGSYLYNNFIVDNMNEVGYKNMVQALLEYVHKIDNEQDLEQSDVSTKKH